MGVQFPPPPKKILPCKNFLKKYRTRIFYLTGPVFYLKKPLYKLLPTKETVQQKGEKRVSRLQNCPNPPRLKR